MIQMKCMFSVTIGLRRKLVLTWSFYKSLEKHVNVSLLLKCMNPDITTECFSNNNSRFGNPFDVNFHLQVQ